MTKNEALKLALEALEFYYDMHEEEADAKAITAIKEALAQPEPWEKFCDSNCVWTDHHPDCKLAQPEQEPVACVQYIPCCTDQTCSKCKAAIPPQRKPLTDEEIDRIWGSHTFIQATDRRQQAFARAIEAAHGIKG